MNENKCICCNDIIPEGRQICWSCEHNVLKAGIILQSYGIPLEDEMPWFKVLN